MISSSSSVDIGEYAQVAIWLVTVGLVVFGLRFARELVNFVLDKLYRLFIENNALGS